MRGSEVDVLNNMLTEAVQYITVDELTSLSEQQDDHWCRGSARNITVVSGKSGDVTSPR